MLHFHHIGVGTTDFDGAIAVYQGMGHELLVRVDDALLNARIALLSVPGASFPYVELVSPLGPDGPLKGLLSRKALPAPYHSCYATPRIAEATSELRRLGFRPTGVPRPALAFSGALVSFHFNRSIGLLELVEDLAIQKIRRCDSCRPAAPRPRAAMGSGGALRCRARWRPRTLSGPPPRRSAVLGASRDPTRFDRWRRSRRRRRGSRQ